MTVFSLTKTFQDICPHLHLQEPLSKHTSWAIGGPADYFADVHQLSELIALRKIVDEHQLPIFFIGAGSNVLVSDRGIRGLVIHLQGEFRQAKFEGSTVIAGAGMWMPVLVKQAAEHGLSGIESLIGVPGTIGGGLIMNAGTRDGVLGDVVESVTIVDKGGVPKWHTRKDLEFKYRHSNLEGTWIAQTTLRLKSADSTIIQQKIDALLSYRSKTQPLGTSNCGSVFKNPPGDHAARLIEAAGLKGTRQGGAIVSERHANFIVNDNKASAQDVLTLIHHIQKRVHDQFRIDLVPEVKQVGDWS